MTREESWILKEKYNSKESEKFFADCKRLKEGEPLAYIIGHVPFLNCTIYLDSHPLIPRPETEYWVEKVIANIQSKDTHDTYRGLTPVVAINAITQQKNTETNVKARDPIPYVRVLDLCAGSGAIGIAIASAVAQSEIDMVEIDTAHNSTIYRTISLNNIFKNKIHLYNGDLFQPLPLQKKYDFILCNPPYIDKNAHTVEKSVADFEPSIALYGGTDGFEIIEKIIEQTKPHLTQDGELWIEHEPSQVERIEESAQKNDLSCVTYVDQYNIKRYSICTHL